MAGVNGVGIFDFGLYSTVSASGLDASGQPSLVQVSTSIGHASVPLTAGNTGQQVIDALVTDLRGDGVQILRSSTTSFRIIDPSPGSFIDFQSTDTQLHVQGAGATTREGLPALDEKLMVVAVLLLMGMGTIVLRSRRETQG
jgi:hypothetical protein